MSLKLKSSLADSLKKIAEETPTYGRKSKSEREHASMSLTAGSFLSSAAHVKFETPKEKEERANPLLETMEMARESEAFSKANHIFIITLNDADGAFEISYNQTEMSQSTLVTLLESVKLHTIKSMGLI